MAFAETLMTLRRQHGLSQEQLGAEIGVSRQTVSKWELGSTTPELDKLTALADFFGISLDQLVGRDAPVQAQTPVQAQAASPQPAPAARYNPEWDYEYRSRRELWGLPLVHINFRNRGIARARGIIAIGNVATGVVALGGAAAGVLAFGGAAVGLISLGGFALGLLAVAGIALGLAALGGFAVGIIAVGGFAVGVYAAGGFALGARVAVGDYARAPVHFHGFSQQAAQDILTRFPNTPRWLARLLGYLAAN